MPDDEPSCWSGAIADAAATALALHRAFDATGLRFVLPVSELRRAAEIALRGNAITTSSLVLRACALVGKLQISRHAPLRHLHCHRPAARSTVDALTFRAVMRTLLLDNTWQSSTKAMPLVSSEVSAKSPRHAPGTVTSMFAVEPAVRLGRSQVV
ncbi:hypothetical protein [Roseomonas sp. USHLN139]|uniref:hypothetical protein n=1 Tax=Roseomonas sp. USHLN139 TaxID=3081298 RepID=UPI003B0165DD